MRGHNLCFSRRIRKITAETLQVCNIYLFLAVFQTFKGNDYIFRESNYPNVLKYWDT